MELTDIMALVKAGYTRDEILQMENPTPGNVNPQSVPVPMEVSSAQNEPETAQVIEPVAVAVPVAVPEAQPQPEPQQATLNQVLESIARLTSAVQANAIAQSVIPGGIPTQPTAEDMLAEIIRPTYKRKEG